MNFTAQQMHKVEKQGNGARTVLWLTHIPIAGFFVTRNYRKHHSQLWSVRIGGVLSATTGRLKS